MSAQNDAVSSEKMTYFRRHAVRHMMSAGWSHRKIEYKIRRLSNDNVEKPFLVNQYLDLLPVEEREATKLRLQQPALPVSTVLYGIGILLILIGIVVVLSAF